MMDDDGDEEEAGGAAGGDAAPPQRTEVWRPGIDGMEDDEVRRCKLDPSLKAPGFKV